jgi:multicomponent Na+:H+ antiporter subunit D
MAPVCVLALITLVIGIGAEPVYRLADTAARELMAPQVYVEAVLGGGRP